MLNDIFLIGFGWLLGLLAPIITVQIQQQRKAEVIRSGIRSELHELKHRMVMNSISFNIDYGHVDRELVVWANTYITQYKGVNNTDFLTKFTQHLLSADDDEIQEKVNQIGDPSTKGKALKDARIPYFEAQLSEIGLLSREEQGVLLEILQQVNIHNDTTTDARDYFSKTFNDSISVDNQATIVKNLHENYLSLANRSKIIADQINRFEILCG